MVAKKKKSARKATLRRRSDGALKGRDLLVMPATVVQFKQIMGVGSTLYALDEDGRVFAYLGHAWMRIEGDDDRVTVLPPQRANGHIEHGVEKVSPDTHVSLGRGVGP